MRLTLACSNYLDESAVMKRKVESTKENYWGTVTQLSPFVYSPQLDITAQLKIIEQCNNNGIYSKYQTNYQRMILFAVEGM
jgi:hypothetical protein